MIITMWLLQLLWKYFVKEINNARFNNESERTVFLFVEKNKGLV